MLRIPTCACGDDGATPPAHGHASLPHRHVPSRYDQALERVFAATNEFEVLELPVELTEDFTRIRKQYRKISLAVHPDKNQHPQADAAFRKVQASCANGSCERDGESPRARCQLDAQARWNPREPALLSLPQVYGAFETLSDPMAQRRLLFELGFHHSATEAEKAAFEKAGGEDEDDNLFQW